jgi:hypothetical protein
LFALLKFNSFPTDIVVFEYIAKEREKKKILKSERAV